MGLNESLILNSPGRGRGREQQRRGAHVPGLNTQRSLHSPHRPPVACKDRICCQALGFDLNSSQRSTPTPPEYYYQLTQYHEMWLTECQWANNNIEFWAWHRRGRNLNCVWIALSVYAANDYHLIITVIIFIIIIITFIIHPGSSSHQFTASVITIALYLILSAHQNNQTMRHVSSAPQYSISHSAD